MVQNVGLGATRDFFGRLFTFLDHPEVDATNNLAERLPRPAVISRKLACGNKTEAGARTWEIRTYKLSESVR